MKKIVLYGAGGFGREVASIIEVINSKKPTYDLVGFVDDTKTFKDGDFINGYRWLGNRDWIIKHKEDAFFVCTIANTHAKARIQKELMEAGVKFETIIALGTFVSKHSSIGKGCVFYGGITISVNCTIGDGVLINQYCTIGHDVVIGNYSSIMPGTGISGNVTIGSEVSIGGHSFVVPKKKIEDNSVVAAGSIVFTNVKKGTTVLGNPARRIKEIE